MSISGGGGSGGGRCRRGERGQSTFTRCWAWASRAIQTRSPPIPDPVPIPIQSGALCLGFMALKLKLLLLNWRAAGGGCCLRKGNGDAALPFPLGGTGNRRTSASSSARSSNLFVGGLSYDTNETALKEAFSQYGDVIAVKVICHPTTGKSKGFGFVNFSSQDQAAVALQNINGQLLDGRNIRVHYAIGAARSAATQD